MPQIIVKQEIILWECRWISCVLSPFLMHNFQPSMFPGKVLFVREHLSCGEQNEVKQQVVIFFMTAKKPHCNTARSNILKYKEYYHHALAASYLSAFPA